MSEQKFLKLEDGKRTLERVCARLPFNEIDLGEFRSKRTFSAFNSSVQVYGNTPIAINIDTLFGDNDTNSFTLSSGVLVFEASGHYDLAYKVTTESTNGTRSSSRAFLELYDGVTWDEIQGTQVFTYDRNTAQGETTASQVFAYEASKGDKIRIGIEVNTGSDNRTLAGSCSLIATPNDGGPSVQSPYNLDCGDLDGGEDVYICFDAGDLS